ncbi:hypothetical protein GXW82_13165 [Streptacidiphilus sp. 4-A2]|nr:hypothetical protein [Streptacidiphilus sp. 4-A2]
MRGADRWQQQHTPAAFVFAVVKKYGDDRGGQLAVLITYYGFAALFPLLLLLTTTLGFALRGNPQLQHDVLNSALADFPIIGDQLRANVHSVQGSALAVTVGCLGLLYGSLGIAQTLQFAMAQVWNIPRHPAPGLPAAADPFPAPDRRPGAGPAADHHRHRAARRHRPRPHRHRAGTVGLRGPQQRPVPGLLPHPHAVPGRLAPPAARLPGGRPRVDPAASLRRCADRPPAAPLHPGLRPVRHRAGTALVDLPRGSADRLRGRGQCRPRPAPVPRAVMQPPLTHADKRVLDAVAEQERRRPEQSVDSHFEEPPPDPQEQPHEPPAG